VFSNDTTDITSNSSGQYLAAASNNAVYTSNDYGTTWTITWTIVVNSITSDSTGQYLAATNDKVYTSNDYGTTWTPIETVQSISWFGISYNYSGDFLVVIKYDLNDVYSIWTSQPPPQPDPDIPISNICFPGHTPIATDQGFINISKINPEIHTIFNKPIVCVTKTTSQDRFLVRFYKHALAKNVPSTETDVGLNHLIYYKGVMLPANYFVTKLKKAFFVKYNGEILYNVLMEKYEKIVVNNLICETLHPKNDIAVLYRLLPRLSKIDQHNLIRSGNEYIIKNKIYATKQITNTNVNTNVNANTNTNANTNVNTNTNTNVNANTNTNANRNTNTNININKQIWNTFINANRHRYNLPTLFHNRHVKSYSNNKMRFKFL
jgi:hypothetical protein